MASHVEADEEAPPAAAALDPRALKDLDVACAACAAPLGPGRVRCATCELVSYCGVACEKAHAAAHGSRCRAPPRWLDVYCRELAEGAAAANTCCVCEAPGAAIIVTCDGVPRAFGLGGKPMPATDVKVRPARWRLCAAPACLGTEFEAAGNLAQHDRTLWGTFLRERLNSRVFRDGTGALARIAAGENFAEAAARRLRALGDDQRRERALGGGSACRFCLSHFSFSVRGFGCCEDARYCDRYCQALDWPDHRLKCPRMKALLVGPRPDGSGRVF